VAGQTFIPPQAVAGAVRPGPGRLGKIARALADRERIPLEDLHRLASFFARRTAYDGQQPTWRMLGGDVCRAWVDRILADVEKDQAEDGSICVAVMLPPSLARQFPPQDAPDVDQQMPPHITVVYATMDRARLDLAERIVRDVCGLFQPFEVKVGGLGHFDHDDQSVAWAGVESPDLMQLRERLLLSIRGCGIGADQTHPDYTPHATIAYMPKGDRWDGPVPAGSFTARVASVWVLGRPSSFCGLGQDDGQVEAWPEDMAKAASPVGKPYPSEHAARQTPPDPRRYSRFRRSHPNGWPAGVDAIYGVVRATGDAEIQSVRFDRSVWSERDAKLWLDRNGFSARGFEGALSKCPVQRHVGPDIHSAGHSPGGAAVKEVEKSLRDLEEKAKDLSPDDQEKLAKALEASAGNVRKAGKKPGDPAMDDEEKRLAKAKQDEEAEKTRKAKEEADAEAEKKAKREQQEKAAGGWPMDLARG
jgi:2'-5' RNA ligase